MTTAERELLKRITADPRIFGGKPIVRGMRIVPISKEAVFQLGVATLIPLAPLLLSDPPPRQALKVAANPALRRI